MPSVTTAAFPENDDPALEGTTAGGGGDEGGNGGGAGFACCCVAACGCFDLSVTSSRRTAGVCIASLTAAPTHPRAAPPLARGRAEAGTAPAPSCCGSMAFSLGSVFVVFIALAGSTSLASASCAAFSSPGGAPDDALRGAAAAVAAAAAAAVVVVVVAVRFGLSVFLLVESFATPGSDAVASSTWTRVKKGQHQGGRDSIRPGFDKGSANTLLFLCKE